MINIMLSRLAMAHFYYYVNQTSLNALLCLTSDAFLQMPQDDVFALLSKTGGYLCVQEKSNYLYKSFLTKLSQKYQFTILNTFNDRGYYKYIWLPN